MSSILKLINYGPKISFTSKCFSLHKKIRKIEPVMFTRINFISTSKKAKETASLTESLEEHKKSSDSNTDKPKNWISWGFDPTDIVNDNTYMHYYWFIFFTLGIIGTGFLLMFQPDNGMLDWGRREGFLELRRREENGLPLIDRDLVPAEKIELPTDEELGDVKIII